MKYAVLRIKGHQYRVSEGEEFFVDSLKSEAPEAEVLLVAEGEDVKVGTPLVKDAKVTLKVVGEEQGEKIYVQKYKPKSRYRRKTGHRSKLTRLKLEKIA